MISSSFSPSPSLQSHIVLVNSISIPSDSSLYSKGLLPPDSVVLLLHVFWLCWLCGQWTPRTNRRLNRHACTLSLSSHALLSIPPLPLTEIVFQKPPPSCRSALSFLPRCVCVYVRMCVWLFPVCVKVFVYLRTRRQDSLYVCFLDNVSDGSLQLLFTYRVLFCF